MIEEENIIKRDANAVYLLVADQTEEFGIALKFASKIAKANNAHVAILYVLEKQEFQHWGDIEARMRQEQRAEAEQFLFDMARRVNEYAHTYPVFYMREGTRLESLIDVLESDKSIKRLILGGSVGGSPGPLISYFSTKGLGVLNIPLTIVPGNLELHEIDELI